MISLHFTMQSRLALNSGQALPFSLSRAGITGWQHHGQISNTINTKTIIHLAISKPARYLLEIILFCKQYFLSKKNWAQIILSTLEAINALISHNLILCLLPSFFKNEFSSSPSFFSPHINYEHHGQLEWVRLFLDHGLGQTVPQIWLKNPAKPKGSCT